MTYRKPGIYFAETINPQFVSLTGSERVVTIIGDADKGLLTSNAEVVHGTAGGTDELITSGEIIEIIGVGDYPGIYNYIKDTDFTLSSNRRGLDWSVTHRPEPSVGATYYATYKVLKSSTNYVVNTTYSIEQIRTLYGYEFNGGNISEISLAAYAAFQNGAVTVKACQINPTTYKTYLTSGFSSSAITADVSDTTGFPSSGSFKIDEEVVAYAGTTPTSFTGCVRAQGGTTAAAHGINIPLISVPSTADVRTAYQEALNKVKEVETDVVVITSTDATIQGYLKTHIQDMSSSIQRKERVGIITHENINDTATQIATQAAGWDYNRMILVAPSPIKITLIDTLTRASSQQTVSGVYSASALAGLLCNPNYAVSESMTRKEIAGFDELGRTFLETEMNSMAAVGVCLFIPGSILVRHAITTDPTNANTQEISIIMIKDYVVKQLRSLLDTTYIGTRILPGTIDSIKLSVQTLLTQLIKYSIINDFRNINAVQDTADPRIVNVQFEFEAVYPLIWMDVTYQLYVA
jgi:hypothetical protein